MNYTSILYSEHGRIATITLNRPDRLNAINDELPVELEQAVQRANDNTAIHVIVLKGAGRSFCAGYDLQLYAETPRPTAGSQDMPWDPMVDFQLMYRNTNCFMSLFRSLKPTVCEVHGFAVAGGSDIALCCDFVFMGRHARIGYPPARVWGVPTTAMWVVRLGIEKAKRMLLTGDVISGEEAARIGLISEAVPDRELSRRVQEFAEHMARIPKNQLMMNKMLVNQACANMGLETTQRFATLFDGIARHTPEGVAFKDTAEKYGFKAAVAGRDGEENL